MFRAMSRLQALFSGREKQLQKVEHAFPEGGVQREAELLLERCEQLGIEGVDKFGSDVGSTDKFMSMLSEVRTAILFAGLGAKVRILKDAEFGRQSACYTPDLIVSFGDLNILVEVFRSNSGAPDVGTPLHRGIEKRGLPFSVEYILGRDLSVPGFGHEERKKHEDLTKEVLEEVLEKLSVLPPDSAGEIVIGEHRFLYKPSPLDRGYAAGGVTMAHYVNIEDHKEKLLKDLKRKADRRASLKSHPHLHRIPFIVAYENWEPELRELYVLSTLTGMRTSCLGMKPPPVDHPPKVMAAWNSPWQRLLREWDYGPDAECRLIRCGDEPHRGRCHHKPDVGSTSGDEPHYGAFDGCDWAQNLSGVLVIHSRHKIQWLPNPFAAEAIRELRLLDLGLSIEKLGSHHPDLLKL